MSQFWSSIAKRVDPYTPGEQPKDQKYVKLNTNENPYPPSPKVLEVLKAQCDELLRLYPDPDAALLKDALAKHFGVERQNVFVGNSSDEVLALSFMAFFVQDKPLLFPDITYSFYDVYCKLYGIDYKRIPLSEDLSVTIDDYACDNGGIVFPNPNAPTGRALSLADIERLLQKNTQTVVLVDEAYVDFGGDSAIALVNKYPNVLVVQTFSKSRSLAGLRVGFAIGSAELIEGLERIKNSFNSYPLDRLSIAGGVMALEDEEYFESICQKIITTREQAVKQFEAMGFSVIPSAANFLFVRHKTAAAEKLYLELKAKGVLVRYFNKPRIDNYLRVTIGTDEEMNALFDCLTQCLNEA